MLKGWKKESILIATVLFVLTCSGCQSMDKLEIYESDLTENIENYAELFEEYNVDAKIVMYEDTECLQPIIRYDCVSGKDEMRMIQIVYTDTETIVNDTGIYAKNGDHYWNLAIQTDKGYSSEDIVTKNILYIEDENMRNAIIEETKKNDNLKLIEDEMEWNTVVIEYGAD